MGLIMKNGIQYPGNVSSGGGSALPQDMSYCYCSFPRTDYSATVTGNFNTPIIFEENLLNNLICENGKVFLTKGKSYLISYTAQATLNGGQYLSVQNSDNSVLNQNGTNYSYSPVSGSIIYKSEKDNDYIYLSCSGNTSADNGTLKKHNLTFSVVELTEGVTSNGGGSYTLPPATSENLGGVIVGSGLSVEQSGKISVNVDAALSETSENPVQNKLITARMNEVFQYVSDGKSKIAAAITDKGITTAADATFQVMADNIAIIPAGLSYEVINGPIITEYILL